MSREFLADLHIHSTFSDGRQTIPEIVDLYGKLGFGAISITDHLCESETLLGRSARYIGHTLTPATFPMYMEILKTEAFRAMDQYGMVLIPGFELTKNAVSNNRSAHILGLGVNQFLHADADAVDLCRAIRAQGALAIAAHPVATRKVEKQTYHLWNRRRELEREFDAWEVASGPYLFHEVLASKLPIVASSDMHVRSQMTSWKTVFECERTQEAVLEAIKKQRLSYRFYRWNEGEEKYGPDLSHDGRLGRSLQPDAVGHLVSA